MSNTTESGRKIVCSPCRARKKRCDGQHPVCSSCRQRKVRCRYPSVSTSPQSIVDPIFIDVGHDPPPSPWSMAFTSLLPGPTPAIDSTTQNPVDPSAFEFNNVFPSSRAIQSLASTISMDSQPMLPWAIEEEQNGITWQPHWPDGFSSHYFNLGTPLNETLNQTQSVGSSNLAIEATSLPDRTELIELADVYFRRVHHFLPILHRSTFRDSLDKMNTEGHSSALIFAVISLATCERQESSVIASRVRWYKEAKEKYASTDHLPTHPLSTLQAAVCLIFQGMMINDFNSAWLTLGKAWRQVVALGYHRLDGDYGKAMPSAPPLPQDWIQRESIRRVIWTLYILDRGLCFPVGLVHNIEDRYVNVNLPMDEDQFQQSIRDDKATVVQFTSSLNKLLNSVRTVATRTKRENGLHYMILAYMLLGHIVAHYHHSDNLDHSEKEIGFRQLEGCLVNLRLCLPRSVTSLSAAPFEHLRSIVWLNVVMSINTIFLYHGKDADDNSTGVTHWHYCLTAARNTVALIREAGAISTDLLLNPHIASALFCSSRILIIEYLVPTQSSDTANRTDGGLLTPMFNPGIPLTSQALELPTKDLSLQQDLDLTILVFERLAEAFGPIGIKFKKGVMFYLHQDVEIATQLKQNGIKDIMSRCASWGAGPPGFVVVP
ncbi:uncharacterized protein K460DRAFT_126612 [Cucurbitaria berberidis CBS 394.84]|uniref:Zn(2)-C6 fungal-type domain-containing protein n=1 Tax=Cucurbitaria berberidis CBS 394.84 TaxID=1168544 RepID=A0A9P4GJ74_9PLEO|nr:uncharacterized protein K460DRAFT_126612 [Cucurbitaria berberidis CBS 394.84]KAF1846585.1 hypothetical protein K460DRAFT_126612 [Cucurbitaria berberidis CBS 394.84]